MENIDLALRWCRRFYQAYEKQVKIAVIAIVVITALLLFDGKGEKEEIIVEQAGGAQVQELQDTEESSAPVATVENEVSNGSQTQEENQIKLVVDISGCIKKPGVYEVADGTRLHEVISMAGGLTKDADVNLINQAEVVSDGQKILIPEKVVEAGNSVSESAEDVYGTATSDKKVNINTADSQQLQSITGVGPATAEKIIQYRETNGRFQSVEDIKNVSGIGEKTFEKMKNQICI